MITSNSTLGELEVELLKVGARVDKIFHWPCGGCGVAICSNERADLVAFASGESLAAGINAAMVEFRKHLREALASDRRRRDHLEMRKAVGA